MENSFPKAVIRPGPVSFMKLSDVCEIQFVLCTTRRAPKMVVLDVDHPDIKDFIYCKQIAEDMVKIMTAGR